MCNIQIESRHTDIKKQNTHTAQTKPQTRVIFHAKSSKQANIGFIGCVLLHVQISMSVGRTMEVVPTNVLTRPVLTTASVMPVTS